MSDITGAIIAVAKLSGEVLKRIRPGNVGYRIIGPTIDKSNVDELRYLDVIWRIKEPWRSSLTLFDPERIRIDTPPRCPRCGTPLKEARKRRRYIWSCAGCSFQTKNKSSFYDVANGDARSIAIGLLEQEPEKYDVKK